MKLYEIIQNEIDRTIEDYQEEYKKEITKEIDYHIEMIKAHLYLNISDKFKEITKKLEEMRKK